MEQLTPPAMIQNLTRVPVLGVLPYLKDPTAIDNLGEAARQLTLEAIMPKAFWVA